MQCRNQRGIFASIAWDAAIGSLAFRRAGVERRQTDVGATLVNHDECVRIELLEMCSPGCSCLFVAFCGTQRLFFRVQPTRLMARPIVVGLTRKPCSCSQTWQCVP